MNDWISDHYKWVFVAPALIFMVLMIVVPIVMTLAFSLFFSLPRGARTTAAAAPVLARVII